MRLNINWNSEESINTAISKLQELVKNKSDKNFTVLNILHSSNSKQSYHILVKHSCGFEYTTTRQKFLTYDRGCPHCNGVIEKYNEKSFKDYCKKLAPDYEILSDYQNTKTKINVKHLVCGNIYSVTPNHFLEGRRCPFCCSNNKLKTTEDYKNEIYKQSNGMFELVGEYSGRLVPTKFRHSGRLW